MNKGMISKALTPIKILLNLIIVAFLLYMVLTAFLPNLSERFLPIRHYVIVSESMQPVILKGDMILVKSPDYSNLKENDIITFYVDTNLDGKKEIVSHYIYSIEVNSSGKRVYKTINANKQTPDSWQLEDSDIIGQYVYTLPKVGKFLLFTQSSIGRLTLISNLLIFIMIIYLIQYKPLHIQDKKQ